MKTLKELFDLRTNGSLGTFWMSTSLTSREKGITLWSLQDAAREWIKELTREPIKPNIEIKTIEDASKEAMKAILTKETDIVVKWIKHFFNLKEE